MARGPRYNVPFRRKREGKTDYKNRMRLVLSRTPRLVVRPTNKNIIVQLYEAKSNGDFVIASSNSNELKKYDWKINFGNIPTAYLTGFIAGFKAVKKGMNKAVLDTGLNVSSKGSRIYAALKGALDAGMEIPHGEEILPDMDRIKGKHISDYAKTLSENTELYKKHFSKYIAEKLDPQKIPETFEKTKEKIAQEYSKVKAKA